MVTPIEKIQAVVGQYAEQYGRDQNRVLSPKGQALLERYVKGQKTSRDIYHAVAMTANQTSYEFFSQGLPSPTQAISNLQTNTLNKGEILIITGLTIDVRVLAATTYQCSSIQNLDNAGSTGLLPELITGTFNFVVNQGVVIRQYPLQSITPRFSPNQPNASAVIKQTSNAAAATPIVYGIEQEGNAFLEFQVPLVLDELQTFGLTINFPSAYTIAANSYLCVTLKGLGVLPNAGLI